MGNASLEMLEVVSPVPHRIWEEVANADKNALISQTPAWISAICATGHYTDVSRLYQSRDGQSKWVLPLVRKKGLIGGLAEQYSPPSNWSLGGLISNCPLHSTDVRMIFNDLKRQPALQTVIHPNPLLAGVYEAAKPEGVRASPHLSHILDLEGGFDKVWKERFRSTTRTAIRKAEKSNLSVEWNDTGEWISIYYNLFVEWAIRRGKERKLPAWLVRRTNMQREPRARFEQIARALGPACRVYVVRRDGKPLAAAVFLISKEHAIYYRGASLREEANPVRANDLLHCTMIEEACRLGCRYYHLGESGGVESLMRFKSGLGGEATPFWSYSIERLPVTEINYRVHAMMKWMESQLLRSKSKMAKDEG